MISAKYLFVIFLIMISNILSAYNDGFRKGYDKGMQDHEEICKRLYR